MSHKTSAPVLSEYSIGVDYLSPVTPWDTLSGLTVYAYSEDEARKLAVQHIGEFHAEIELFLTEEPVPVVLKPGVVATETISDRDAVNRSVRDRAAKITSEEPIDWAHVASELRQA